MSNTPQHHLVRLAAQVEDEHSLQQSELIRSLLVTGQHFFGGFKRLFSDVADSRHPAFITYPLSLMLTTGVPMFLLGLGARRQVNLMLRQNGPSSAKFKALFCVETCPYGDTLHKTYSRLSATEVQAIITGSVKPLIRRKVLYPYCPRERYFLIAIDGTGTITFPQRHCRHCLRVPRNEHTAYYHAILEAKMVTHDGFVVSVLTEFTENPGQHPTKQNCELKAFCRLTNRLKRCFPRLPICLLLDGLFAGGPTFSICEKYGWKYLTVLQENSLPSVQDHFNSLLDYLPDNHIRFRPADQYKVMQDFDWVNHIACTDSKGNDHVVSVIRCLETKSDSKGVLKTTRFK